MFFWLTSKSYREFLLLLEEEVLAGGRSYSHKVFVWFFPKAFYNRRCKQKEPRGTEDFFSHRLGVVLRLFFLLSEYFIALLAPKRAKKAQHTSKNCRHTLLFVNRPQVSDITHPSAPCRESLWLVCRVLRNSLRTAIRKDNLYPCCVQTISHNGLQTAPPLTESLTVLQGLKITLDGLFTGAH